MADRSDLLRKIKACLALAKGASEHEAAAALAKARELMDLYGVDEAEIAMAEVAEATAFAAGTIKPSEWLLTLVASIGRAIPVKALLGEDGITFVGLTPAPEIASYAFTVLLRKAQTVRREYIATQLKRCSLKRKRARADIFCEGWAYSVFAAVAKLYPQSPLDPIVRQYLDRRYANLSSVSGRSAGLSGRVAIDDRARGRDAGRDVSLHQGVGESRRPAMIGGAS